MPENGENSNRSNEQKSNFARAAHFFVHFFAVVLDDYNVKLPETFYACMEEMLYVFSFTFFPLPLILSLHWWPLAFPFSRHRRYKIFMLFFQQKNVSFVFYLSL